MPNVSIGHGGMLGSAWGYRIGKIGKGGWIGMLAIADVWRSATFRILDMGGNQSPDAAGVAGRRMRATWRRSVTVVEC